MLIVCLSNATNTIAQNNLDPTFGIGGKVVTDISGSDYASDVLIQPDGKIIVAAWTRVYTTNPDFVLLRYNANGSLDASFGNGGKINNDFGDAIALQHDGKILVSGGLDGNFVLARYNADGSIDTTFGTGGKVTTDFSGLPDSAYAITIQTDGKIIAAGIVNVVGSNLLAPDTDADFGLARYNPDGSLDSTFGSGGKVMTEFNGRYDYVVSLALQFDGKIVAAGFAATAVGSPSWNAWNLWDNGLARYNPDGSLDSEFGIGGKVVTDWELSGDNGINALVVQADGTLFTAGYVCHYDFCPAAIARYNAAGTLISQNWGGELREGGYYTDLALQPDGKIVAANQGLDFVLERYNADGTLDPSFGTGGKIYTDFGGWDFVRSIDIQPNGKILAVGTTQNGYSSPVHIALARYFGDLVAAERNIPFDFDGDGKADISLFRSIDRTWYLNQSTAGFSAAQFGSASDKITPADFDGDGKTDIAVYREGIWYLLRSAEGFAAVQFGLPGDIPVPADFTGDGRAELAVYRNGVWYTLDLQNNQFKAVHFGLSTDKPIAGDFDGDNRADYAVYRDGTWYLNQSMRGFAAIQFGLPTDKLVPADYDGDGKTDIAVYRDGTWFLQQSRQGFTAFEFGIASDIPVPADYDGDGRADPAVYREGIWYLLQSTSGFAAQHFGLPNDKPVPTAFSR